MEEETMQLENSNTPIVISKAISEPMTEVQAAARLGLKVATLRAWRHRGKGPAFVRLGRAIRYLTADVDEFVYAHRYGVDTTK
jgi:predicted DNA-binding transcriptional regulator AlpA